MRNNATRALAVLVRSNIALAREVPPGTFIEMACSGIWTDRNKSASLLERLTFGRDPVLLSKIHAQALDCLIEMAAWRRPDHAFFARMVVGRVGGLPEAQLAELAWKWPPDTILKAASGSDSSVR